MRHEVLDVGCGIGGGLKGNSQIQLNRYNWTEQQRLPDIKGQGLVILTYSSRSTILNLLAYILLRQMQYRLFAFQELNFSAGLSEQCNFIKIVLARDLAEDSPCPWYWDIDAHLFSWSSFSYSGVTKFLMRAIAGTLEFLRIAPKGSSKLVSMLHTASNELIISCREQIFTVTFFVLGRKPHKESDV
ncbi:unnamed protein product [Miscanthus lutarioriparius]|uniref:Sterol methyltransferase C-terminal domain-containing protein n=1 Tax=Miscanthus lutarioriparius TaxID=422564 RepID=A0A811QMG1_9POAL|nr:unnamed protein product [Miscanthus lutarioriparius]